jgi:hypothetical protein
VRVRAEPVTSFNALGLLRSTTRHIWGWRRPPR